MSDTDYSIEDFPVVNLKNALFAFVISLLLVVLLFLFYFIWRARSTTKEVTESDREKAPEVESKNETLLNVLITSKDRVPQKAAKPNEAFIEEPEQTTSPFDASSQIEQSLLGQGSLSEKSLTQGSVAEKSLTAAKKEIKEDKKVDGKPDEARQEEKKEDNKKVDNVKQVKEEKSDDTAIEKLKDQLLKAVQEERPEASPRVHEIKPVKEMLDITKLMTKHSSKDTPSSKSSIKKQQPSSPPSSPPSSDGLEKASSLDKDVISKISRLESTASSYKSDRSDEARMRIYKLIYDGKSQEKGSTKKAHKKVNKASAAAPTNKAKNRGDLTLLATTNLNPESLNLYSFEPKDVNVEQKREGAPLSEPNGESFAQEDGSLISVAKVKVMVDSKTLKETPFGSKTSLPNVALPHISLPPPPPPNRPKGAKPKETSLPTGAPSGATLPPTDLPMAMKRQEAKIVIKTIPAGKLRVLTVASNQLKSYIDDEDDGHASLSSSIGRSTISVISLPSSTTSRSSLAKKSAKSNVKSNPTKKDT